MPGANLFEQFGKTLELAGQVARVDRHGNLRVQQFGVQQGALGKLGQQASGQVVDAVEPVVFEYVQRGALARARTPTDDDQPHLYPIALATVLHIHDDLVQAVVVGCLAQTLAYLFTVEHAGDLAQQLEVLVGGRFRDQQDEQQVDRAPSMASKSTGVSRRSTALTGALQPTMRQCGMAMPLPKPVEPSFHGRSGFRRWSGSRGRKGPGRSPWRSAPGRACYRPGRSPGTSGGQDVFESDHNERQRVTAPWVWSSCFSLCLIS